jgi:phosphoribosylglycinamide formyltransferase-1
MKTTPNRPGPIGVLISGRGTNLQALIEAQRDGRLSSPIAVVVSNRADAAGLQRAAHAGIETLILPHGRHATRDAYDGELADALRARGVSLVCLAGFMRLLGAGFCSAFPNAILNIHRRCFRRFREWTLRRKRSRTASGSPVRPCTS